MSFSNLDQCITQFAAAAIRTQEICDEAWQRDWELFQTMIALSPIEHRDLLRPLSPSRQLLRKYEFELSTIVSVSMVRGFKIQALPLNFSYSITREARHENHSKFRLWVEQIPIQE